MPFLKIAYYVSRVSQHRANIEIGVIVVKKHDLLNFVKKYVRLKWKKEN